MEASGWKAQTGCRLDWDFNCHFKSDKLLICPPGTERLDIVLDKCAVEQKWQEIGEDKMPSATSFFFLSVVTAGQQPVETPVSLLLVVQLYPVLRFEAWEHEHDRGLRFTFYFINSHEASQSKKEILCMCG